MPDEHFGPVKHVGGQAEAGVGLTRVGLPLCYRVSLDNDATAQ